MLRAASSPTRRSSCSRSCSCFYTVVSYYTDKLVYDRRQRKKAREGGGRTGGVAMSALDVRAFTVGPVQENSYIVRAGERAPRAR